MDNMTVPLQSMMRGEAQQVPNTLFFRLCAQHFQFRAVESVFFPVGKAGNVLRGSLGPVLDTLTPAVARRPSGFEEPPRPFVLRATHLDGKHFEPGEMFAFDIHFFDLRESVMGLFADAFADLARTGLGPRRGRVELIQPIIGAPVDLRLDAGVERPEQIIVTFRTPTELKGNPARASVPFGVLFARVRDRISTLRSLYGEGPLPVDFKMLSNRADLVRTVKSDLQYRNVSRSSSRTGAVHGIGGFTGIAEYEGDLAEFLPWLRAAWWTGVGRHTVWGNGVIELAK
jgi:hypothetical protein